MSSYSNKNILITGGLGFIGSNLARALVKEGGNVTVVDSLIPQYGGSLFNVADIRNDIKINITDIRDPHAMSYLIKDKHFLFNLAGQTSHIDSMTDPFTDLEINSAAQLSILEACRKNNNGIKIVFASTRQLYGKPNYLPVDENHPICPVDVNGINKLSGEMYHFLYNNVYGIPACALRLTNTYGPGMRVKDSRQTFLGIWFRLLIERKPIKVFGDGLQLRDFNYVDDCVRALLLAGSENNANGKVFNLGSKEVVSLKELAKLLVELNPGSTFELEPFPGERKAIDIGDYYADYSQINKILGWSPKIDLREGLLTSLDYYKKNFSEYWSN
jgi:dTDP-glucose 4,6-dehydratase/UDP-glucose 4-epimerase